MAAGKSVVGEITETRGERIEKAHALSLKAHKQPADKHFLVEKISGGKKINNASSEIFIGFPASPSAAGSVKDWYSQKPFGEGQIDLHLFPSLKSIGNNEAAKVNDAFQRSFQFILAKSSLENEVKQAMSKNKQIVFTGHSSGAPMAILATLWTLDRYFSTPRSQGGALHPLCVTFGSPLVGNHIFSHATRRENWSHYFIHFLMRYDIVPRILLAPLSCFDPNFEAVSRPFNPKTKSFPTGTSSAAASDFYFVVISNAKTVASHAASKLMGSADTTLETLASFVPLSPYRPFGTYVFCAGNGKQVVVRNPDAVLQILFFAAKLSIDTKEEADRVADRSFQEHVINVANLRQVQNVVYLDQEQLQKLPLNDDGSLRDDISMALNDLGLSTEARLCLRATAEFEERRQNNLVNFNNKKGFLGEKMKDLKKYKKDWEHEQLCYYDTFRNQEYPRDFQANVRRLELAGVWDEIVEKLRSYELPDEFEADPEWVKLGKKFRRLVEPLDIANYYRHTRHVNSGPYMDKGRPRRYKYTQRWLEHAERTKVVGEGYSESCFWAEVEDLMDKKHGSFGDVKERVVRVVDQIRLWIKNGELGEDVLLEGSTLVKWWEDLPLQHKQEFGGKLYEHV